MTLRGWSVWRRNVLAPLNASGSHAVRGPVWRLGQHIRYFRFPEGPIDLSSAKEVELELLPDRIAQAAAVIWTITPKHEDFQRFSIHLPFVFDDPGFSPDDFTQVVGDDTYAYYSEWEALDHAIARLCESHAIRVKVVCHVSNGAGVTSEHVKCFFFASYDDNERKS